jgi:hypothetical protein
MIYSRPYEPSSSGRERGQKAPGANTAISAKDRAKIAQNQRENDAAFTQQWIDDASKNMQKYSHNRYAYGLTSAGVYVYAHDKDKYISQMTLVPTKNVPTVPPTESDATIKNPTTMIRPVSDERGFELIGHYRYGRGISLRDGSLILNSGGVNSRVSNQGDLQLALAGNTAAMLNAQSQGLTTAIAGGYTDPASALTKLTPEDLQSAGTIVPETGKIAFTDTGTNFVDSAPLGSPEQKGVPTSVEASQFSRALTLSELTVRFDGMDGTEECECQLGRADLTFISTGYQVRTLRDSSPTVEELLAGDLNGLGDDPVPGQVSSSSSIAPFSPSLKGAEFMNRVETYLFNLYKTLDETHQAHEATLRGAPDGEVPDSQSLGLFDPETTVVSGVAPPFSAMNRAALGDPVATALQGKSSREDIVGKFRSFGDDLKKSTESKKLGQEIANLKGRLGRLNNRLQALQNQGPSTFGNTDDEKELLRQVSNTEQEINHKELELAQLTS